MSKRSLASSSASPSRPKKKSKLATGQARLDTFFGASSSRQSPGGPSNVSPPLVSQAPTAVGAVQQSKTSKNEPSITDEQLAWALAAKDGLDVEALRKLETETRLSASRLTVTAPRPSVQPEVIDVDLIDDESSQTKQSLKTSRTPPAPSAPSTPTRSQPSTTPRASKTILGNSSSSKAPTYKALDVDPPTYDLECTEWPQGSPVPYSFLAHTLATLSSIRSRIAKIDTLTNALRTICRHHPPSLLPTLYLCSNTLSPPYSPIELGLGPSIITKAIQHVSGLSSAALKRLYNATGDPG
ncbi:hypothetical protein ONZ51_g10313 [Trametes cubensis]|uniref:DNA ligase ATP-dependent N-terminal domain-containing protein n=1 Tax=Trametes cubensis TaxID=1111947 RepID=A0AAD7TJQ9_9APHY|nr:hypothetical protein ONZ51_g10313 [Trametes cubensis]